MSNALRLVRILRGHRTFSSSNAPAGGHMKKSMNKQVDGTPSISGFVQDKVHEMGVMWNWTAGWSWAAGFLGFGALILVAFEPELKESTSKHTADVASRSLQDEALVVQTQQLASDIIRTVLNDEKVVEKAASFVQNLTTHPQTQDSVLKVTNGVILDPQTLAQVTKLSKQLLVNLVQDPATTRLIVDLIKTSIADPQTKQSLVVLLDELMKDPRTKQNLAQLVVDVCQYEIVMTQLSTTLGTAVHEILDSRDIQNHAKSAIGSVLRDQTVQIQGGDALWSTILFSFTPRWIASWIYAESVPSASSAATTSTMTDEEGRSDQGTSDSNKAN